METTEEASMLCDKCGAAMKLHGFERKEKYTYPEYVCPECQHVQLDKKGRELNPYEPRVEPIEGQ